MDFWKFFLLIHQLAYFVYLSLVEFVKSFLERLGFIICDKIKKSKERFNRCNKRQIHKVSKLINKHYTFQKIHKKGVKDQLSDQKIKNKRATCSDTT